MCRPRDAAACRESLFGVFASGTLCKFVFRPVKFALSVFQRMLCNGVV